MSAKTPKPPGKPPLSAALLIVITSIILGLFARGVALTYAPQHSYRPDHTDFMAWAEESWRGGASNIYAKAHPWPVIYRFHRPDGRYQDVPVRIPHACNYLPLSTWIFWAQGGLWSGLADEVTLPGLGGQTGVPRGTAVTGHVANTLTARFVGALPAIVFDFILAWGVAALVLALGGDRIRAALAFALTVLAPPVFLDSAFWNQVDSWVAAPLVWTTVLLIRQRFIPAGIVYGIALLLKPHAILLGPVLLFAAFARGLRGASIKAASGPILTIGIAAVVALILSLPHSIAGAKIENLPKEDQAWKSALWFKRAYVDTVAGDLYKRTTLNAFNLWWFDYQANGGTREALDSTATILGMTKDDFGKVLLGLGLIAAALLAGRKWGWQPVSYVGFAFMVMLCAFMLPTRVHERYIFLCIPFVIALSMIRPAWLTVMVPLLIVGTFEMTSFGWAGKPDQRSFTTMLAVLSTIAMLISFALLAVPERQAKK